MDPENLDFRMFSGEQCSEHKEHCSMVNIKSALGTLENVTMESVTWDNIIKTYEDKISRKKLNEWIKMGKLKVRFKDKVYIWKDCSERSLKIVEAENDDWIEIELPVSVYVRWNDSEWSTFNFDQGKSLLQLICQSKEIKKSSVVDGDQIKPGIWIGLSFGGRDDGDFEFKEVEFSDLNGTISFMEENKSIGRKRKRSNPLQGSVEPFEDMVGLWIHILAEEITANKSKSNRKFFNSQMERTQPGIETFSSSSEEDEPIQAEPLSTQALDMLTTQDSTLTSSPKSPEKPPVVHKISKRVAKVGRSPIPRSPREQRTPIPKSPRKTTPKPKKRAAINGSQKKTPRRSPKRSIFHMTPQDEKKFREKYREEQKRLKEYFDEIDQFKLNIVKDLEASHKS